MEVFALDFETANCDYASICQIGIAKVSGDQISVSWQYLIDPEDYFDPFNVGIHGITAESVRGAPTFPQIYEELRSTLEQAIVIHHMPFERVALHQVLEKYGLDPFEIKWLDSARVARRTWDQFRQSGYGLKNVTNWLNYSFNHHDAEEDAKASAEIVLAAIKSTGKTLDVLFDESKSKTIGKYTQHPIEVSINTDGDFFGEHIVFTGALEMSRREAAIIAAENGYTYQDNVNKKTSTLVIGTQDLNRLNGRTKSNKQIKAEELITKGQEIKILTEEDFKIMLNLL